MVSSLSNRSDKNHSIDKHKIQSKYLDSSPKYSKNPSKLLSIFSNENINCPLSHATYNSSISITTKSRYLSHLPAMAVVLFFLNRLWSFRLSSDHFHYPFICPIGKLTKEQRKICLWQKICALSDNWSTIKVLEMRKQKCDYSQSGRFGSARAVWL